MPAISADDHHPAVNPHKNGAASSGHRIGRRVIKNGYMGALGQVRLAMHLVTSPIDGLRGREIRTACIRKLRLLHGPFLPRRTRRGFFVIVSGRKTRFGLRHKPQCRLHGGSF